MSSHTLRMGTRGSLLARLQSASIAQTLEKQHEGLKVETVIFQTTGDKILDRPLHEFGGKGLFTKEIEEDLHAGRIDFIVHSCKDVPVTMPLVDQTGLMIGAIPRREDPRDAFVSFGPRSIAELRPGAVVGTGSLRRRCQLLALRPDLNVQMLRGNVDTRVRKCREGQYTAVLLAMSGLRRSGLFDSGCMTAIPTDQMLPAAGQGALLIQCRENDIETRRYIARLNDTDTATAVRLERGIVASLNGDCHSPIAALASVNGGSITLHAAVGARGGNLPVITACGTDQDPQVVLQTVMNALLKQNARELLATGPAEALCPSR